MQIRTLDSSIELRFTYDASSPFQNVNSYAYANGNPVNLVDPLGLSPARTDPIAKSVRPAGCTEKKAESEWTPPFPLERFYVRTKVIRMATASERPSVGLDRARDNEPACISLWPPGQHEVPTNDKPRHQPARPETRPNQRLYVSFGSPPLVAVGTSPARAAHQSRAPKNHHPESTVACGAGEVLKARRQIWVDIQYRAPRRLPRHADGGIDESLTRLHRFVISKVGQKSISTWDKMHFF
jgi:hypothetical protein